MSISPTSNQSIAPAKNILIIGSGGRENSLAWGLINSEGVERVFVLPGNGGTENFDNCVSIDIATSDIKNICLCCKSNKIDLVVIGPEVPLANGLADTLRKEGLAVFGPGQDGAQLEASKDWAKHLMNQAGIPTARHWTLTHKDKAIAMIKKLNQPLVVKANGLAAGKGVTVPKSINETIRAVEEAFKGKFGAAGQTVILEEILTGPEVSIFGLCDGERMILLPPAQDHKRLNEGDIGPNTGGMGAYAPAPLVDDEKLKEIRELILDPTLEALKNNGIDYRGVIYAGLMLTPKGPQVIEFNCRFGDPECQTLIPLLGNELAQVLYACALGKLNQSPKLSIKKECSVCVIAAASGYPYSPRQNDLIDIQLQQSQSIQLFHSGTKLNKEGELLTSGGRVLSVVAQGENFDQAFSNAYEAIKNINFKGMTYRRDIGHQVRKALPLTPE